MTVDYADFLRSEFACGAEFGGFTGTEALRLAIAIREAWPLDGAGAAFEQGLGEGDPEVADEDDGFGYPGPG